MANYDLAYEGSRVQSILDTGDELRDAGYIFRGEATPSTVPGTPTERVAYIGGPGTYTNFGSSITVGAGCICVFKYTGSAWSNQVINTGLDSAVNTLQNAINAINSNIGNGYVYAGVATPSTSPVTGKVFYLAVQAGTYTNFGNAVVTAGLNVLKYNGSAWSVDQVIAIDAEPTQGSANLVKSGGVLNSIIQNGPAFDLSAYLAQGGVLATYADLSAALTALNALPADFKKGGMSMKFVLSSDNKYIQARCMAQNFTTDVTQWQTVDTKAAGGSKNLVESGGVAEMLLPYTKINVSKLVTINALYANDGSIVQTTDWNYLIIPVAYGNAYKLTGIPSQCSIKYIGTLQSVGGACTKWEEQSDGIKELCILVDDTSTNYIVFNIVTNATLSDFANITVEGTNKDSISLDNGLLGNAVNITEEKVHPNAVYNNNGIISSTSDWYYLVIPANDGYKYKIVNLPPLCTVGYTGQIGNIGDACLDWKYWHSNNASVEVNNKNINYIVFNIEKNGSNVSISDFATTKIVKTPIYNNNKTLEVTFDDFSYVGLLNIDGTIDNSYNTCKVSRYYPLLGVENISVIFSNVASGNNLASAILYDTAGTIIETFDGYEYINIDLSEYSNAAFVKFSGSNNTRCIFTVDKSVSWYKSYEDFKYGYGLLKSDGTLNTDYTNCYVSDYILLKGNEVFYLANGSVEAGGTLHTAVLYDINKQVVGTVGGILSAIRVSDYTNARFIRFSNACMCIIACKDNIGHPRVFDKNFISWNAVGDSITEGNEGTVFSHPEEDMCMLFPQIKQSINFQVANNCGKGGTTIAINASSAQYGYSFVERICGLNGATAYDDAAIWTIMGGVNDANYGSTLGTIDNTASDTNTVYGALKAIIENIQARPNNPKLLFIIPPYMNYSRTWDETMLLKYKAVCDAMIEVCELYNIPYLNLYKTSGYNYNTILKYTYDGIHPNVLGVQMIKDRIVNFINENI